MIDQNEPTVIAQMLIRKPVAEVFNAFIDPAITTKFWFTKSSGPLAPGKRIRWDWEMYGVSTQVTVIDVEPNRRLRIEWGDPPSRVAWQFAPQEDNTTLVTISCSDFSGSEREIVAKAIDAMGGFTNVLAGLKALLEHNVILNLVTDHHPDALIH